MPDKTIFIISNEPWGKQWFSKHYYASDLAENNDVFYLNPVKEWRISNLFNWKIRTTKIHEHLTVINYCNPFPLLCQSRAIMFVNDCLNSLKFKSLTDSSKQIILWQFDPYRFIHLCFKRYRRIYHVVDPYQSVKWDKIIAAKADLVVTIRQDFRTYYKSLNTNTILIPHGVGALQKSFDPKHTEQIRSQYKSFILYVGTISNHINTDLLLKIAIHFSGINLLMVGPYAANLDMANKTQLDDLQRMDNFFHIEIVDHTEISNYIRASEVCIIPYSNHDDIKRTPLKIIDYIAQYKPVVSSYHIDIKELEDYIVFSATNDDKFIKILNNCLNRKLHIDREKVNAYLDTHTYKKWIDTILSNDGLNI